MDQVKLTAYFTLLIVSALLASCASNSKNSDLAYLDEGFTCATDELIHIESKLNDRKYHSDIVANIGEMPGYTDWLVGANNKEPEQLTQLAKAASAKVKQEIERLVSLVEGLKLCGNDNVKSFEIENMAIQGIQNNYKYNNIIASKEKFMRYAIEDLSFWDAVKSEEINTLTYTNENYDANIERWIFTREGFNKLIRVTIDVNSKRGSSETIATRDFSDKLNKRYFITLKDNKGNNIPVREIAPILNPDGEVELVKNEDKRFYVTFYDLIRDDAESLTLELHPEVLGDKEKIEMNIPKRFYKRAELKMPPLMKRVSQ